MGGFVVAWDSGGFAVSAAFGAAADGSPEPNARVKGCHQKGDDPRRRMPTTRLMTRSASLSATFSRHVSSARTRSHSAHLVRRGCQDRLIHQSIWSSPIWSQPVRSGPRSEKMIFGVADSIGRILSRPGLKCAEFTCSAPAAESR